MDIADGLVALAWPERLRRVLQVGIVVALATAFVPAMIVVALLIGLVVSAATLLALAPWKTAAQYAGATVAGCAIGALLNLPWITSWSWDAVVGPPPIGDPGRGLGDLAAFEIGPTDFAYLGFALYLPVVAALLLARAWRLTWAVRAGSLVATFGALAVFGDRGSLPVRVPEAGVLLAPVAVGLAVSAAAALAAFDLDVRGGSFGWRQPLGLTASAAVIVGLAPGLYATGAGDWDAPSTTLSGLIDRRLPDVDPDEADGDYNVLILGDARILPVPGVEYRDGISFAVISDDGLDIRDRWTPATNRGDRAIRSALDEIASGSTQRAGRLLAPLGIRFVVVPEFDGVVSTFDDPLEPPLGLVEAIGKQLDIVAFPDLPTVEFFQNSAWIPNVSLLTGATAEASDTAGDELLVRADLTSTTPAFITADHTGSFSDDIEAGTVHLAVPFDDNWQLTVDGERVPARRAFGLTTAFDVESPGRATLTYSTGGARSLVVAAQVVLWLLVLFGATRVSVPLARRRAANVADETLISLDDAVPAGVTAMGFDPGLDVTGQVARDVDDVAPDAVDGGRTGAEFMVEADSEQQLIADGGRAVDDTATADTATSADTVTTADTATSADAVPTGDAVPTADTRPADTSAGEPDAGAADIDREERP